MADKDANEGAGLSRTELLWLLGIGLVATALNLFKAFHIDDAIHLEIATHILRDPLHPMRGAVDWSDSPAPLHSFPAPHLFFYLMAAVVSLFGASEVALHLLIAAFLALSIWAFTRIARLLLPERDRLWATAFFFLGPALLPSQNVMAEVPLLAFFLLFFEALITAHRAEDERTRELELWRAALFLGLGALTGYAALSLLPVLSLAIWARRKERGLRHLRVLLLPAGLLLLWSLFNLWDYGGVHLLESALGAFGFGPAGAEPRVGEAPPSPLMRLGMLVGRQGLWVLALGAVAPLPLAWGRRLGGGKKTPFIVLSVALIGALIGLFLISDHGPKSTQGQGLGAAILGGLALANGLLLGATLITEMRPFAGLLEEERHEDLLLCSWFISTMAAFLLFSSSVGVHHLLLALPALYLFLLRSKGGPSSERARRWALVLTAGLGIAVAVADHRLAEVYREQAPRLARERSGGEVYFFGHGGWQRYARRAGMLPFDPWETELVEGDVLIRPLTVDQPVFSDALRRKLILRTRRNLLPGIPDLLRTMIAGRGFYALWPALPYTFTAEPIERFEIYEVVEEGESDYANTIRQNSQKITENSHIL